MADWQRRLMLNPEWQLAKAHQISIQELAGVIAQRLRKLRSFGGDNADLDDEREDIADDFEAMSKDESVTRDEFDDMMGALYDWGDTQIGGKFFDAKKVCWIDTMSRAPALRETA